MVSLHYLRSANLCSTHCSGGLDIDTVYVISGPSADGY